MKDSADRVGRYQLLGPIGTGPCGVVSRAKVYGVAGFERQFAVKRFHPDVTITAPLAQSLSAAARAYGSLEHPRIARMSEFGVAQGQTFTAVELVTGVDGARLVAEARLQGLTLAAGGALALVSQAARAVGYAHGRGLTHLGLSPTNMIITADGDVKITDFGILAAGMPPRPLEVSRLARRIQYLAPEQLANEATSAATDVFQLGVIAYELVTGEPTFRGGTPQQIAQAILAGPPPEPALPRPIVRVLARCLARSPFERFPDARALADALDAALRVAPVPGTRKDVGVQVQATMDRLATLNDGELSGMVALHVGTGPVTMQEDVEFDLHQKSTVATASSVELATEEFVRPDVPVPGPTPLVGPAMAKPAIPSPPMGPAAGLAKTGPGAKPPVSSTLMGIRPVAVPSIKPPPSIPAITKPEPPPSVSRTKTDANTPPPVLARTKSAPNLPPPAPAVARTKSSELPPPVPSIARTKSSPDIGTPPAIPSRRTSPGPATPPPPAVARTKSNPEVLPRPTTIPSSISDEPSGGLDVEALFEGVVTNAGASPLDLDSATTTLGGETALGNQTVLGVPAPAPAAPPRRQRDAQTAEMAPAHRDQLVAQAQRGISATDVDPPQFDEPSGAPLLSPDLAVTPRPIEIPATTLPGSPPPPAPPSGPLPVLRASPPMPQPPLMGAAPPAKKSRAGLVAAVVLLGGGGLAVGGWQLYERVLNKPDDGGASSSKTIASTATADAAAPKATVDAAAVDAAAVVAQVTDAAEIAKADAAAVAATVDAAAPADAAIEKPTASGTSDVLSITSTPAGARVYLDGADSGVTPLKLPASPDKHTIALLLPGHELYIAQVDGSGKFQIPLTEVTPSGGPAGIKVIRCKDKDRYYVFVDGKPTGMMCPTERVNVETGPHTVEIYDAVTETRRKWDVVVKDTRLSYRVKVE